MLITEQPSKPTDETTGLDRLWHIPEIVRNSETISVASAGFAAWLGTQNAELIFHCKVLPESINDESVLFSALPHRMKSLRESLWPDTTCPLITIAARSLEDFDAKTYSFDSTQSFVQAYVSEINAVPFKSLAVIVERLEHSIHVFFIGLEHLSYEGEVRGRLRVAVSAFCSAVSTRFPIEYPNRKKSGLQHPVSLSGIELQCLQLAAIGKSDWQIAKRLQLSERAISHCFDISLSKLKASNRTHAIALAVHLNIISGDNTVQKLQYPRSQD